MSTRTVKSAFFFLIVGLGVGLGALSAAAFGASVEAVDKKFIQNEILEGANLYNTKGIRNYLAGRYVDAADEFQSALQDYERIDHQDGYISAIQNLGLVYFAQGQDKKANECFLEALRRSELLGYKKGKADSFQKLGGVWSDRGKYDEALGQYAEAQKIYGELRDTESMASLLNSMGVCLLRRGKAEDLGKAELDFAEAAKLNRQLKKYPGLSANYINLSQVSILKKNPEIALDFALKALSIDKQIEDSKSIGTSLATIGSIYEGLGKKELAFLYHQRAYGTSKALQLKSRQQTDLQNLVRLAGLLNLGEKKAGYEKDLAQVSKEVARKKEKDQRED